MAKKFNLKELIESVDWVAISANRSSNKLPDNAVCISFQPRRGQEDKGLYAQIKFGQQVVSDMGWEKGDKIVVMNDPDDFMSFLLVKCETGAGRTLGIDGPMGTTTHRISFKWNRPIPVNPMPNKIVEYETYKKQIYFRVNDVE